MLRTRQFGFIALLLHASIVKAQPNVAQILGKVSETYKAVSQYEFVIDGTSDEVQAGSATPYHALMAFKAPNKYKVQGRIPGLSVENTDLSEVVMVYDGSTLWFYFAKMNQYGSITASALASDDAGDSEDMMPEAIDDFMMRRDRDAANYTDGAKFLRNEALVVGGVKLACYVVTFSTEPLGEPYTLWIDQRRYRVLREDHAGTSAVFTRIKLDEPLPPDLFKFAPPPGARRVELQR
jgi:outer membrane lipoprotein-sorting protein